MCYVECALLQCAMQSMLCGMCSTEYPVGIVEWLVCLDHALGLE